MRFLNVEKELMPVSMFVIVEDQQWEFVFSYNSLHDYVTCALFKDSIPYIQGEKVLLEKPLFSTVRSPFETTFFVPMDLSKTIPRLNYENFNDSVLIYQFEIEYESTEEDNE